jgi:hypothetical protein
MSFKTPITIAEVVRGIQSIDYVLPAIQREFVWDAEQIEKLFDSLLRGYPIGSFLFWEVNPQNLEEFQFYRFMDNYHQRDQKHNQPINLAGRPTGVIAVLDGQQRLTALNIGLKGWYAEKLPYYRWDADRAFPKRRLYLNLLEPLEADVEFKYEFELLRDKDLKNGDAKHWFLVEDILSMKEYDDTFEYCIDHGLTEGGKRFPSRTLGNLFRVIREHLLIHYFQEEDQDLDKVLNIFIRVNSGGTILSYSDMLLSIATAQWRDKDARQEIYGLVDDLNNFGEGFDFTKDFVLKSCLVLSDLRAIEFKVSNFNRKNMLHIEDKWEGIRRALLLTAKLLASWGYSRQTLVSNNAVIPLAYYLYNIGNPTNFVESGQHKTERDRMQRWLIMALLKRTFSGQSDNVLRNVRQAVQSSRDGFPMEAIFEQLRGTTKDMTFSEAELEALLDFRYHQSHTFTVLALLYPWLKYDQNFHMDHIFPRSMFTEKELSKRGIHRERWDQWFDYRDSLANLQLLQGLPNQEKSDREFEAWIQDAHPRPNDLITYRQLHLIPKVDLTFENFPAFIQAREEMIKQRLRETLSLKEDL